MLDLLYENGTLGAHPIDTPMDFSVKLDLKVEIFLGHQVLSKVS